MHSSQRHRLILGPYLTGLLLPVVGESIALKQWLMAVLLRHQRVGDGFIADQVALLSTNADRAIAGANRPRENAVGAVA